MVIQQVLKIPAGICLRNANNRNTITMKEICSKLTIKTPEQLPSLQLLIRLPYYGLYDPKTRTGSTSVSENLHITHVQSQGKPFCKVLLHGADVKKIRFDILMKTCKILSKIMVILDIYCMKVLTIFTVEYHTTFFEFILKDWACIKCFACFFGLITFFASKQCRISWGDK